MGGGGVKPHPLLDSLPEVDSFVVAEFFVAHVSVVTDYLPDVLWWHVLLLGFYETEFPFFAVSL